MLLYLPRELRDEIYVQLFSSTRLTFGDKFVTLGRRVRMKPAPQTLAILLTCRQINQEAGALWLRHVLFNFEDPLAMLDKLLELPSTTRSKIRHVRTRGHRDNHETSIHYDFSNNLPYALKLLPNLCLQRVNITMLARGDTLYHTIDELIKQGKGWKELRIVTREAKMYDLHSRVGLSIFNNFKPQPSTWEEDLLKRDGADSGFSVNIYRSVEYDAPGAVFDPSRRELIANPFPVQQEDATLASSATNEYSIRSSNKHGPMRDILFVIKRGRKADIAQPIENDNEDIQAFRRQLIEGEVNREMLPRQAQKMTVRELRRNYIETPSNNGECDTRLVRYKPRRHDQLDKYDDIDEHEWTGRMW